MKEKTHSSPAVSTYFITSLKSKNQNWQSLNVTKPVEIHKTAPTNQHYTKIRTNLSFSYFLFLLHHSNIDILYIVRCPNEWTNINVLK